MSDINGGTDPLTTDQDTAPPERLAVTLQPGFESPRIPESRAESTVPLPGFRPFKWPQSDWNDSGDVTLNPGLKFVTSWTARITEEKSSPPPLKSISPITSEDSGDSFVVQTGTQTSAVFKPIGPERIRSVHRRRTRQPLNMSIQCEKPAPADDFIFRNILCETGMITNRSRSEMTGNDDRGRVPQWRLARGGTIHKRTITSLSSSPGEGLCLQTYNLQCGGPRSSGRWSWGSVKPSPLPGVAGRSRIGLAFGNESRPMV